jgi:hypothetical protein
MSGRIAFVDRPTEDSQLVVHRDTNQTPRGSSIVPCPRSRLALVALAATLAACYQYDSVLSPPDHLPLGTWGGTQAWVTTMDTLTDVSLGCASGNFPGRLTLDSQGRFNIAGTWNISVGPVRLNGYMPAQLSGQILGNYMTFAVAVNDTVTKQVSSLGPATVEYGKQGTIEVCPV